MRYIGTDNLVGEGPGSGRTFDRVLDCINMVNWKLVDPASSTVPQKNVFMYPLFASGDCVSWKPSGRIGEGSLDVIAALLRSRGEPTGRGQTWGPLVESLGNSRREPDNGWGLRTRDWIQTDTLGVLVAAMRNGVPAPWKLEAAARHKEEVNRIEGDARRARIRRPRDG